MNDAPSAREERAAVRRMKEIEAFTDGACRGNPGPGGWGALLRHRGRVRELSGGEAMTTNNRMEMTAAIRVLEALKEPCRVQLYTDSTYLRNGITQWLPLWLKRGWRTAGRKAVKNQDLWQELARLTQLHDVSWHWVRGHSGHPENERADRLANEGLERALNVADRP